MPDVLNINVRIHGKVGSREVGAFCCECGAELFGEEAFTGECFINVLAHPSGTCSKSDGLFSMEDVTLSGHLRGVIIQREG